MSKLLAIFFIVFLISCETIEKREYNKLPPHKKVLYDSMNEDVEHSFRIDFLENIGETP